MAERKEKVYIRVKLCFEDPPLDTPKCLWYLISTKSCSFISDVCYSIQKRYLGDKDSISLTMDDYAVPMEESVHLLKDNDVLRVHRQHNRIKSKKRPRVTSDSVQESGKEKKQVKRLCKENTNSPFTAKKGQTLNTSSHKSKFLSGMSGQLLVSPHKPDIAPALPRSTEGVPHQSIMSVLGSDQKQSCTGQHLPLGSQLDSSSTETVTVKTVKSRTGGVHKRFTTPGSSNSDSDEAEETKKDVAQHSSLDTGVSAGVQWLERNKSSETHAAMSSKIVGGRKDKFKAVSTVIHVPADASMDQYDLLPDLHGLPRVGDKIAFKMLEMSSEYTPELSNFKSAIVMCVTPTTNTVRLRYTEDTVQHEKERAVKLASGKFALGSIENEEGTADCEAEVDLHWNDLQEAKLIPQNSHP